MGALATIATATIAATEARTNGGTKRPMPGETDARAGWLPEALALRLEQLVLGEPPREAQEAGVRHHTVRRPHAPAAHGPAALQDLDRLEHAETTQLAQTVEGALHRADGRAVGENDAAAAERGLGRGGCLPSFRQVEEDSVEIALFNPLVDIAELERQVRRQLTERLRDAPSRRLEELLACFVADDGSRRTDRAQRGEGKSAGPGPRLEHARAGVQVGADEDRAEVFRVDGLRLPPAAGDLLGERRPDGEEPRAELRGHDDALRAPQQVVVKDEPGVDRMLVAGPQPDPMPPADLVDENDDLAFGQRAAHAGLWARISACQYA